MSGESPQAWLARAQALQAEGQAAAAAAAYAQAGNLAVAGQDLAGAEPLFRAALAQQPGHVDLAVQLAQLNQVLARPEAAGELFRHALALDPRRLVARLGMVLAELRAVYPDRAALLGQRRRFGAALAALTAELDGQAWTVGQEGSLANCVSFELAYQGLDDSGLQRQFGTVLQRAVTALWPDAGQLVPPPLVAGERIRVGFLTGHFYDHTVIKLFGGWMEALDRRRFAVHGIACGRVRDATTARLAASLDGFLEGPRPVADWAGAIRALRLHALVHLDVGMAPMPTLLAGFRLAPLQAMTWGHPVTSGLPHVDLFLSADLMEPPDGDDHYAERLVRLPGISVCYRPPQPAPALTRAEFGLPAGRPLYFSGQYLPKHLPQYDRVFVEIARRVPEARIVLLGHQRSPEVTAAFVDRLGAAFAATGLALADHVLVLPHQPPDRFQALLRVVDIYVDSVGWSGGVTSLEAIMAGLPLAAVPTALMRGRHTAAFLAAMGLPELIHLTVDAYIEQLAAWGRDAEARARAAARVVERRGRLIGDLTPVRALEDVLEAAVRASVNGA